LEIYDGWSHPDHPDLHKAQVLQSLTRAHPKALALRFWLYKYIYIYNIQCEAPKIAKLVNITPITMAYGTYNELVTGAYKPTYNWGASHCIYFMWFQSAERHTLFFILW